MMMDVVARVGGRVAGMLWYQGESDCNPELAPTYAERFTRFVSAVREAVDRPDLPVLTAQLNRVAGNYDPLENKLWGVMRETQRQLARALPNVAVVPTLDLTLSDTIHNSARGNITLGGRFARSALAMAYGHDGNHRAPDLARAEFQDHTSIALEFDNVRQPLVAHQYPIPEFIVEDDEGEVPLEEVSVMDARVILKLSRETKGSVRVHGALSPNPAISLKDDNDCPILGFCDVPVE